MGSVVYAESGQTDLLEAWLFIAEKNLTAADGVLDAIEREATIRGSGHYRYTCFAPFKRCTANRVLRLRSSREANTKPTPTGPKSSPTMTAPGHGWIAML